MFSAFFSLLYIQISPDTITIRDVRNNLTIEEPAELAVSFIERRMQVIAVGHDAQAALAKHPTASIARPFAHPRTLTSEYLAAEALITQLIARTLGPLRSRLPFKVVLHLMGDPEGGFAKVEIMVFRKILLVAICRSFVIWQGSPLSDQALLSGEFPSDGQILDQIGK
jgi:rod shape-determining protein MreB